MTGKHTKIFIFAVTLWAGSLAANPARLGGNTRADSTEESPAEPPFKFNGTNTLISEYVGDNGDIGEGIYGDDDDFWMFRDLFHLKAENPYLETGLRLDAVLFHNPPYHVSGEDFIPGGSGYTTLNYGNDFRIERIYGTVHLGNFHITAGDYYVGFGRGLALSLLKVEDAGIDNTLRGAKVEYRLPRKLKAILVAGVVNSSNVDVMTRQIQKDDPLDRIVGARVEGELLDALNLGSHVVYLSPRFTDQKSIEQDRLYVDQSPGIGLLSGGASVELHLGGLHAYLEGNGQQHDNYRPAPPNPDIRDEAGFAAHGEVSYDFVPFSLKGEALYYHRWLMEGPLRGSAGDLSYTSPLPYHNMITLELPWIPIRSFGNARGGRITGESYLNSSDTDLTLYCTLIEYLGGLLPQGRWEDHPPTLTVHSVAKVRQGLAKDRAELGFEGGFRYEYTDQPETPGRDTGHLWHLQTELIVTLTGPHSLELQANLRRHHLEVTEGDDYYVTLASLGYNWSGTLGLTVAHEYSDQFSGTKSSLGAVGLPWPKQHYLWLLATFYPPDPLDDFIVRFLMGSQRGGIKCVGGVCRVYPDSVGAKLEVIYRF